MPPSTGSPARVLVALPTEGVDRNFGGASAFAMTEESPSPRRAWIEIL